MLSCGSFYMGLDQCFLQGSQLETALSLILWVIIAQLKSSVWTTATCFSCTVHPLPPPKKKQKQGNKQKPSHPVRTQQQKQHTTNSFQSALPSASFLGLSVSKSPFQVVMGSEEENALGTLGGLAPGNNVRIERKDCCFTKTIVSLWYHGGSGSGEYSWTYQHSWV